MMKTAATVLTLMLALGAAPVLAANAEHPNSNVDPKLDKGGPTGDSQVDKLNKAQLDAGPPTRTTVTPAPVLGAPLYQPVVPPRPAP